MERAIGLYEGAGVSLREVSPKEGKTDRRNNRKNAGYRKQLN